MGISQSVSTGRWIVTFRQEGKSRSKAFPPDQEQQARRFEAERIVANEQWKKARHPKSCHDPWDRRQLYMPVRPDYTEDYQKFVAEGLTLAEAITLFLDEVPHSAGKEADFKNLVFGHTYKDGSHRQGPAEALATKKVQALTRLDLEKVRTVVRAQKGTATTVNDCVSRLKTVFNWCLEQDFLAQNPWQKYKSLPAKHGSHQGSLEEFERIYPYLPPWMQWASLTALSLCLRPGIKELFALQWKSFNWRAGTVSVWMPKVGATKLVYPPDVYLEHAHRRFTESQSTGQQLVCPDNHGRQVTYASKYFHPWKNACLQAGVDMPMYALRHIAASEMLAGGADLAAVAAQLGHKNITTTGVFYAHAVTGAQRRAAENIPLPDAIKSAKNTLL